MNKNTPTKNKPAPKPFPLVPVESSSHRAAGHDPATGEFRIAFHNGATYSHAGVPPEVYAAYLAADSKGRFYNAEIRGRFPHTRLEPDTKKEEG